LLAIDNTKPEQYRFIMQQQSQGSGQFMVDRTPAYESTMKKKKKARRENQVLSASGIIRPDKRERPHYL